MNAFRRVSILLPIALIALAGCAMRPAGEDAERRRAAEAGYGDGAYSYGVLLREGKGVPLDISESARWLKRAAPSMAP